MDYKEKYEMALEGIQEILGSGEDSIKMSRLQLRLQGIFPELAKSEDERIREKVIATIHLYYGEPLEDEAKEMIYWLEKQGEQTAEWSKEDKRNFDIIYGIIYNSCNAEDASRLNAWLLSLRPQKQWKPSLAQLNALSIVSKGNAPDDIEAIVSLYNDLKKLKG